MAGRRYGTIIKHLKDDPDTAVELCQKLSPDLLLHLGTTVNDELRHRAIADGNQEAVIAEAFDSGFGRDGLALLPWIEGPYVVCPGGLIAKSRTSHRCRFVSVNDTWIWQSGELIHESKRSTPGVHDGFRAVALLPLIERMELDVVSCKLRQGSHTVEKVVSYEVRKGALFQVSQRVVAPAGMH